MYVLELCHMTCEAADITTIEYVAIGLLVGKNILRPSKILLSEINDQKLSHKYYDTLAKNFEEIET